MQIPPMHSAKKIAGQRLYELARQGVEVEREARPIRVAIEKLGYEYPILKLKIDCSSGTYIRSLGYDIGEDLGCGGHLISLVRTKVGEYTLEQCIDLDKIPNKRNEIKK